MPGTWIAGQKLQAIDMVPRKIWTMSSTSAATAIAPTTETVISSIGTAPATTYRAGRAYLLSYRFRMQGGTADQTMVFRIRDTTALGTIRMDSASYRVTATGVGWSVHGETYVANTGASDITGRVLVLTGQSPGAGNLTILGSSTHNAYWNCIEMGSSDDYPEAIAL